MTKGMDAARHLAALRICADMLELPVEQRASGLHAATGGDDALAELVHSLLAYVTRGAAALPTAGGDDARNADRSGTRLGAYQLDRLLGSGGMGAVYLARRDDHGVAREVALKIMHRQLPGATDLARFATEQRALASLHHPYVAAFIDVGVADDGTPYYAMEYVPGTAVTTWCDEQRWSVRQRVGLFLQICEAVESAHRKLIVHRDIKPANVLVTEDGHPKLLDFGVAKLLGDAAPEEAPQTTELGRHLTLDYASPERILHGALSTGEDVYALGVLLFELLVGTRPFRRAEQNLDALVRGLETEPVPTPAQALAQLSAEARDAIAAARQLPARRLVPALDEDLQAIFETALHRDGQRRYGTVDQLAEDLRRWLRGQTVRARGDSGWYRLQRFVARHRLGVSAAALALVALVLAVAISLYQAELARREAMRATAVSSFLEQLLAAPNARWDSRWRGGPNVQMRDVLTLASEHVAKELPDQPEVQVQLRGSLARAFSSLGMHEEAIDEQRKALMVVEHTQGVTPLQRVNALTTLAIMLDYSPQPAHRAEARQRLRTALAILDGLPGGPHIERAVALGELCNANHRDQRFADAINACESAIAAFHDAGGSDDDPLLAVGLGLLAVAYLEHHEFDKAVAPLEHASRIYDLHREQAFTDATVAYGTRALAHLVRGEHDAVRRRVQDALRSSTQADGTGSTDAVRVLTGAAFFECELGRLSACASLLRRADAALAADPTADASLKAGAVLARAELDVRAGRAEAAVSRLEPLESLATTYMRVRSLAGFDVQGRWYAAMARAQHALGNTTQAQAMLAKALQRRRTVFGADAPWVRALEREGRGWLAPVQRQASVGRASSPAL